MLSASGFTVAMLLIVGGADSISARYSGRGLLAAAGPLAPGAPLYTLRSFDWTAPFYARRFVTPVEWRGELDYGLGIEPARGLDRLDDFRRAWDSAPQAYALMERDLHAALVAEAVPMRVLSQDFERVLVSRR